MAKVALGVVGHLREFRLHERVLGEQAGVLPQQLQRTHLKRDFSYPTDVTRDSGNHGGREGPPW